MKNNNKANNMNILKKTILTVLIVIGTSLSIETIAQNSPPAPPDNHGESGNQDAGGGAPIGGGLFILLGLGIAYSGKKLYNLRKNNEE